MEITAADKLANLLVVVGGLNWGLVGFFKYNLVSELFGSMETVERGVYGVVGLAALYLAYKMAAMMSAEKK